MRGNIILLVLALWPMLGGFLSWLTGRKSKSARDYFADAVTVIEFALLAFVLFRAFSGETITFELDNICGMTLYLKEDGFRAVYSTIAGLMWMMTTIFSKEYLSHYRNRNRYYMYNLITFGATVGVFLSCDLFTTYIFFEIMSLASYVIVAQDEKPAAMRNGGTYLAVGVIGGMVMLMGLFLLYNGLGTLDMDKLAATAAACEDKKMIWAACLCMMVGFGAKAGAFPLHFWLPKTHPVAPAPASALLSGILTKAGIFGILITTLYVMQGNHVWGMYILITGVITMVLGAVLAVFSIDLKRTLACSSLSQIGFILTGTGMASLLGAENALAARGTLLHMVNHSLIKLVLFMAAGVVYMNLHKLDLNEIRGFGRHKPLLNVIFLMGLLGIAGVPLWNGYISKTLIHESIVEYLMAEAVEEGTVTLFRWIEALFLLSGGLTFAYMLKLYICIFWEKNVTNQDCMDALNHKYMNGQSVFALGVSAVLLPVMGMLPYKVMNSIASLGQGFLMGHEPEHSVHYFSLANLKGGAASLLIGVIVYFLVIRVCLMAKDENGSMVYIDAWPAWLDIENVLYRPLLTALIWIGAFFSRICDKLADTVIFILKKTVYKERHPVPRYKLFSFQRFNSREFSVQKEVLESFSFGLLMFAVGLSAVLIYLVMI